MYKKRVLPIEITSGDDFTFAEWIEEPDYISVEVLATVNGFGKTFKEEFIVDSKNLPTHFSGNFEKFPEKIQNKMISLCKALIRKSIKNRPRAIKESASSIQENLPLTMPTRIMH